ncbi:MAG: polysaccharide deacetylase family protein [Chloroflexota bacterium]
MTSDPRPRRVRVALTIIRPAARTRRPRTLRIAALVAALLLLTGLPVDAVSVVTRGSSAHRWVALTFDDGWSVGNCERIAASFRARGARATFLINGVNLDASPGRWRRLLRGMPVASHGYTHLDMTKLSTAGVISQVQRERWAFQRVLGRPGLSMLRPPYGAYDSHVLAAARSAGVARIVLWSVDTKDWVPGTSASTIYRRAIGAGSGGIVLMHCGPDATASAVPSIIRWYQARGYQLVGLGQLLNG